MTKIKDNIWILLREKMWTYVSKFTKFNGIKLKGLTREQKLEPIIFVISKLKKINYSLNIESL